MPIGPRRDSPDQAAGKVARELLPRTVFRDFRRPDRDPVDILEGTHVDRDPDLIPILVGRMLNSPFAFYRGAAALMAHDLADDPTTGHLVVACGDAHAANFGFYASPERRLVFDLNDFDEAYPGPWEGDVKRLAASCWLSGRNNGHSEQECREAATSAVRSYRLSIWQLFELSAAERYYWHLDAETLAEALRSAKGAKRRRRLVDTAQRKARQRTSEQVLSRLTATSDEDGLHIVDQPPVVRHPDVKEFHRMEALFRDYRDTLLPDVALLLSQYELVDYAMRIVGVGSVGLRAWVFLLVGPSADPLFLQAKQARQSVLHTHGGVTDPPEGVTRALVTHGQGFRVVGAQQILQALSDPFLGWVKGVVGEDGVPRDYYIRQYRDMKGGFALEDLDAGAAADYAWLCGRLLARAHSQSPGSRFITGYLGRSEVFDEAVADWAGRYADQSEADHDALARAVAAGRLPVLRGI